MKNHVFYLLVVIISLSTCRDDVNNLMVETDEDPPIRLVESSVFGRVVDEAGDPLANAMVSLGGREISTGLDGNFEFNNLEVEQSGDVVTAQASGFYTGVGHSTFSADGKSFVEIKVLSKGTPELITSTEDAIVSQSNGLELSIPANSLMTADGQLYTGEVKVFTKWIDPTDEDLGAIMPGALVATDQSNQDVVLATYGMIALDLEAENGDLLLIADGASILTRIPIPSELLSDSPDEIPLWEYDLEEGKWLEDGKCVKDGSFYVCNIVSTGYWNCDVPLQSICLSVQVFNEDQSVASFVKVVIEDLTDNFIYWGYTDKDGFVCGSVPQSAPLKLTILDHCDNVIYMEEIGAFDDDVRLEDIILDQNLEEFFINVKGTLSHCLTNDVPQGHLGVSYPGTLKIFPFVAGTFDVDLGLKCIDFPEIQLTVYSSSQAQSTITQAILTSEDVDLGAQLSCEDLDDSFTFKIDDLDLFAAPTQYYLKPNQTTDCLVLEGLSGAGTITIELGDYQGVGTYSDNVFFSTIEGDLSPAFEILEGSSPGIQVEVTEDNGEYIIGNFSGEAKNEIDEPRNISGDFKVKKAL